MMLALAHKGTIVRLKHIPGHKGILGNKIADKLAKNGAELSEYTDKNFDCESLDVMIQEMSDEEIMDTSIFEGERNGPDDETWGSDKNDLDELFQDHKMDALIQESSMYGDDELDEMIRESPLYDDDELDELILEFLPFEGRELDAMTAEMFEEIF
jgi:hypothetical protein